MIPKPLKFYLEDIKLIENYNFVLKEAVPFNVLISSLLKKEIQTSSEVKTYLDTLKFPRGCSSKQIFQRKKETYLPLVNVAITQKNISNELDIFTKATYDLLNTKVNGIKSCIEIALMEIFNNVRSHSKADNVKYIAQRWFDEHLEIAIYDNGVGFKQTLNTTTEKEALELAVQKKKSSTNLENRGWGIQTLKALVLNEEIKGEFMIISNDSYYYISRTKKDIVKETGTNNFNIKGSMIILRLNNLNKSDFENIYEIMLMPDEFSRQNNLID